MAELSWRSRTTLITFFIIAAVPLAAFNSSRLHHCATCPNSGSEVKWGITWTQDSRDSFIDSGCPFHMVADEMLVDRCSFERWWIAEERLEETVVAAVSSNSPLW